MPISPIGEGSTPPIMAATVYDLPIKYLPFQKRDKKKSEGCGCGKKKDSDHEEDCDCEECSCSCNDDKKDCGCCAPGLVSAFDDEGKFLGCLTPNDAELYQKRTYTCQDGYVKLFNTAGDFLGCVTPADFATTYPLVNT